VKKINNNNNNEEVKKVIKPSIASPQIQVAKNINPNVESNDKVVIDIASCDGPVRFRRVLNDAYEQSKHPTASSSSSSNAQPQIVTANESTSDEKYQSNTISFHQQMVKNINEQYNKQKAASSAEESENSQNSMEFYTCVYCNHTFKSKYCYQKHAKRHINPLNTLGRCNRIDDCESSDGESKKQRETNLQQQKLNQAQLVKRDSIKPLDMNVQYYPCKFCGCKFPSYYFVHKHRKLCHPEIENDGNGNLIQIASPAENINQVNNHVNNQEENKSEDKL
jgi:hypothetical protein